MEFFLSIKDLLNLSFFFNTNSKKHKLLSAPPLIITTDSNDFGFSCIEILQHVPVWA